MSLYTKKNITDRQLKPDTRPRMKESPAFFRQNKPANRGLKDLDVVAPDAYLQRFLGVERSIFEMAPRISNIQGVNNFTDENEILKKQLASLSEEPPTSLMPKTREDAKKEGLPLRDGGADYSNVTDLVGLIKTAEGLRTESYWDFKQYSVGYGSKGKKGEVIDEAEAEKRLAKDISKFRAIVVKAKETHGYDWNSDQIDALTSFTHNLGATNFNKLIDGGKRGDEEIIEFLPQYNKARVNGKLTELAGLTDRRNMELKVFEQGFES
tara:strand:+ start:98 stop:898 length:801 start_codon:yes stop_codon:yes gene_type:complete